MEEEHLSEQLFLEMKNYSFFFDDERFDMDIVPKVDENQLYELYFDDKNLYILVPFLEDNESSLEIFYPLTAYQMQLDNIKKILVWQFIFLSFIALFISVMFSFYALYPLRRSLLLLEEFIKDIIHDLNTPITSILINLKMMEPSDESKSIAQSANTITMLHKNLDAYLKEVTFEKEELNAKEILEEQIEFFSSLYDYLTWHVDIKNMNVYSNRGALSRIIYNLLSNACKYNASNGFVNITLKEGRVEIQNSSYGIKNPSKVFNRFYKESDRGLGIGLHIVEKLCDELEIKKELKVNNKTVTFTLFFL